MKRQASVLLQTLPGDDERQIMWRFAERRDLQVLVQAVRSLARGPVARLVAAGGRDTNEWTRQKGDLLDAFDRAGITRVPLEPSDGGLIEGPKNLALALVAFELAWVDAGAASVSLAQHLALGSIAACGTAGQRARYLRADAGPDGQRVRRGAFALTEPIPHAGVNADRLGGRVRVAAWPDGQEPTLKVEKRGRFITNMGFAEFVTAAVASGDARIKGSCLVVLEEGDRGVFDRGVPTRKLVHQLSSTRDPRFSLEVPASRIVGGYTIEDGVIVPARSHTEILDAVFRRTRVTVALMTAAKLLSSVEPILRYQRTRFRGADGAAAATPAFDLGLQLQEDARHRLVDVWAAGEASAALGFATARLLDQLDSLPATGHSAAGGQAAGAARELAGTVREDAVEYLRQSVKPEGMRDDARLEQLEASDPVRVAILESVAAVLSPACKLWNGGYGATMMREALNLVGGVGLTADCPGFLGFKWMDAQLEATYEGAEAAQRQQLAESMIDPLFLLQFEIWISEMRHLAARRPGSGACTVASAMELWLWTVRHLLRTADADGELLYQAPRQGVSFALADAICWLLASRHQILDALELEADGPANASLAPRLPGTVAFFTDLAHAQAARSAGEVGRIAAELVHGYNRHPGWDAEGCAGCYNEQDLADLEQLIPGIESTAGAYADVLAADGSHKPKAGPCVHFTGLDEFVRLRGRLDGCLTGARLAKDRASAALAHVTIPDALDYPR